MIFPGSIRTYIAAALLSMLVSCGTLSKKEITAIQNLTTGADSLMNTPEMLFMEIAGFRMDRSLFYAAGITSPETRQAELKNIAMQFIKDSIAAGKASAASDILSSYLRALKSVSSETRWKQTGTELRGTGRNLEDAIESFNALELIDGKIGSEYITSYSGIIAKMAEGYSRARQKRIVRDFINESDTLVTICCRTVEEMLKKNETDSLLANEEAGLYADFASYQETAMREGFKISQQDMREYVRLNIEMERLKAMRKRTATVFTTLRNAHSRLKSEINRKKGGDFSEIYDEIIELADLASDTFNTK